MSDAELEKTETQAIWVDLYEAAEITGYSVIGVRKIVQKMNLLSQEEREVNIRKRTGRWELWLPDLLVYISQSKRGPHRK
jgi:hypothetical protein